MKSLLRWIDPPLTLLGFRRADPGIAKQPRFPTAYFDQVIEPFRPYGVESEDRPPRNAPTSLDQSWL